MSWLDDELGSSIAGRPHSPRAFDTKRHLASGLESRHRGSNASGEMVCAAEWSELLGAYKLPNAAASRSTRTPWRSSHPHCSATSRSEVKERNQLQQRTRLRYSVREGQERERS